LVTNKVKLPAGSNSEIVVQPAVISDARPADHRFDNNLRAVQKGRAAEAVAHVAAAGPIDIRVDKKVVFANVATGEYLLQSRAGNDVSRGLRSHRKVQTAARPVGLEYQAGQADLGLRDWGARQRYDGHSARDLI
jgi:hypothetical protein